MIPFSPPRIDQKIIDEVTDTLRSGWITTGPKTKLFENKISKFCDNSKTLCVSSATAGLELIMRWFGVKEGDEVILPAYTYCATANVVIHCGAKPVLIDSDPNDFNIDVNKVQEAITSKTKVIMPVDIAGFPCRYDKLSEILNDPAIKKLFCPTNEIQKKLGRILLLADAAHSFGAIYQGKRTGTLADITVFSFHAVKNLTTAEGGAIALNLPLPFFNEEIYEFLNIFSLHGQNKDALAKTKKGSWRYDVVSAGYKANMTDILASIGLVEIDRYEEDTLKKRKLIFNMYNAGFEKFSWAQIPCAKTPNAESSYHAYLLRIRGINEKTRDKIISLIFDLDVSVNVHFQPLPLLSFYKSMYDINNYPYAYDNYAREISLPVYYDLSFEDVHTVIAAIVKSVESCIN